MDEKVLEEIRDRLGKLEREVFSQDSSRSLRSSKAKTLPELARGKKFKNGQEKVVVIVGHHEKIGKKTDMTEDDIRKGWIRGKLDGKYRSNLLERAVRDGLVRDLEDGTYDLTQSGERFFETFLTRDVKQNEK